MIINIEESNILCVSEGKEYYENKILVAKNFKKNGEKLKDKQKFEKNRLTERKRKYKREKK